MTQNQDTSENSLCMITVVFTADSDDVALAVKKSIDEVTTKVNNVRVDFRLTNKKPAEVA